MTKDIESADERLPIIDAHQHFWNLDRNNYPWLCDPEPIPFRYGDYSALRRNYLPADYRRDSVKFRIVKTVHMEAEWDRGDPVAETQWLSTLAAETGLPTACVAHAEPDRKDIGEVLAGHARFALVRGIRHKPRSAADPRDAVRGAPGSMDDPRWRSGYALLEKHGFSYDLQTPWWHLDAAADLAADFPRTRIVINHTGLPADRSRDGLAAWRRALETAARAPNVALKISGIGQRATPWTVAANGPIVRDAIAVFGVDRCMFASNFPVDKLVVDFTTMFDGYLTAVAELAPEDRRKLFHDNAARIYRL